MSTPTSSNGLTALPGPTEATARIGTPADGVKQGDGNASFGADTTSGLAVSSPVTVGPIKPVDHNAIQGSNAGDHRAPANQLDVTAFAKNSPAPRESVGQFKGSKFENQPPFVSTPTALDSDAGN